MLEATYHKMLVQSPPDKRLEALRAVSKLLGESSGLMDMTLLERGGEEQLSSDMALIIM